MNTPLRFFSISGRLIALFFLSLLLACGPSNESDQAGASKNQGRGMPVPAGPPLANRSIKDLLQVESLSPDDKISSPLEVRGQARGYWYFEGEFSIELQDADGHSLAQTSAKAQSNWMTEEWVPFKATLEFNATGHSRGYLYFEKANPSGQPEQAKSYRIPVVFEGNGAAGEM